MSTWLDDIKRTNPALAADYAICGNQPTQCLRNMVRALSMLTFLNTPQDIERLNAAKRIIRHRAKESAK